MLNAFVFGQCEQILLPKAIFTARKRSLRRLCFHRCLSVHRGGAGLCPGGLCAGGLCLRGSLSGGGGVLGQGDSPHDYVRAMHSY